MSLLTGADNLGELVAAAKGHNSRDRSEEINE